MWKVIEKDPNRPSGALDASPHKEPSGIVIPGGKVTEVLSIRYKELYISEAILRIVIQFGGKETKGWFEYKNIGNQNGIQEALDEFRPKWNSKKESKNNTE
jgi:hypothetical protein